MEETSAPPPTTSFTDTLVTVTFSLITGKMTNHMGERITKAFRRYIGSDGTQAAPRLGNWSVSFIIRSALLTKASQFVNQSLGLPDLRFTTSKKQQTGKSRNAQNTPKHTSKGIIDTHLTAAEFAKKFNMNRNNIIEFKPITSKSGTKQAILTFNTSIAPLHIVSDNQSLEVSPLLLAVHRCYKCQHFGHTHARCRNQYTRCMFCSRDHASGICQEVRAPRPNLICPNCNFQGHAAGNQFCPALRDYKAKIDTMNRQIMTDWEARKTAAKHTPNNTQAPPPKPMQASYAQVTEATTRPKQAPAEPPQNTITPLILPPVNKDRSGSLVSKENLATILKCLLTPDTLSQLQTMTETQREDAIDAVVYSTDAFVHKNQKQTDQVITIEDEPETTTQQPPVQTSTFDTLIKLTGLDKQPPCPSPTPTPASSPTISNSVHAFWHDQIERTANAKSHARTLSPLRHNARRGKTGNKRLGNLITPDAPHRGPTPHGWSHPQKLCSQRVNELKKHNF